MENKEVVRLRFGSHLYGTATAKSDLDFKGVFLPCAEKHFEIGGG